MANVLVTGAGRGIGKVTTLRLAAAGWDVYAGVRKDADAERLRGAGLEPLTIDVTDQGTIDAAVAQVTAALAGGGLHGLVNNAGIAVYHLFIEAPDDEFEEVMRANYLSAVYFTREVIPSMIERKTGAVVFVSSFAGRMASWRHTAYAASKFAMTGLAEALYYEVKNHGVHVAIINPGVIKTELFAKGDGFEHLAHVVEPQYLGTEVATRAIVKAIEKERFELFAPAKYTIIWKLRALFSRAVMSGTLKFVAAKFERST